jgi:hypothetical protein
MEILERWSTAFPAWSAALGAEPDLSGLGHLPFSSESVFWHELSARVGALFRGGADEVSEEARELIVDQLLDVFAPVCTVGARPPFRWRLRELDQPQREAVSALVERLTDEAWILEPWREAALIADEEPHTTASPVSGSTPAGPERTRADWRFRVSPPDNGRLLWWWRKESRLEANGHSSPSPVMTSIRRDHSELALRIARAFDGVPQGTTRLVDAWNWGCDEAARRESHRGRWQDVPDAELWANPDGLSHLDAAGLRYYAPRLMLAILFHDECSKRELAPLCDTFRLRFRPRPEGGDEPELDAFTPEQRELHALFVAALVPD